jgi:hypothetical protein
VKKGKDLQGNGIKLVFLKKLKYDFEIMELSNCPIEVKVSARVSLENWRWCS